MKKINLQKHSRTLRLKYLLISVFISIVLCLNFFGFYQPHGSPAMNTYWTNGSSMPNALYFGGSAAYQGNGNDWLFVIGGTGNSTATAEVYKYDLNSNIWSAAAPYPSEIGANATAVVGDTIYSFGGFDDGITTTANSFKYNINANTWTPIAPLREQSAFMKAIGYQDSLIYICGGFSSTPSGAKDTILLYNTKTNSYRNATTMPLERRAGACTIVGDTIVYMCGFAGGPPDRNVIRGVISQTDRSIIDWSLGVPFPGQSKTRFNAQPWGDKGLIMTGGTDITAVFQSVSNECYTYSPGLNEWTVQLSKPTRWNSGYSGSFYKNGIWKLVCAGGYSGSEAMNITEIFVDDGTTSIHTNEFSTNTYRLFQNYPNPFNPETTIKYNIPYAGHVELKVYNAAGKEVCELVNKYSPAGMHEVKFNGSSNGYTLSSGVYFYKLKAGNFTSIKKMILIK